MDTSNSTSLNWNSTVTPQRKPNSQPSEPAKAASVYRTPLSRSNRIYRENGSSKHRLASVDTTQCESTSSSVKLEAAASNAKRRSTFDENGTNAAAIITYLESGQPQPQASEQQRQTLFVASDVIANGNEVGARKDNRQTRLHAGLKLEDETCNNKSNLNISVPVREPYIGNGALSS